MTGRSRVLLLAFSLVGLGASLLAAYIHQQLLSNPSYLSFCDVSETVSCTQVYGSRYGTVMGVSVAVYGAIFFAFTTLLAAVALVGPASVRDSVPGYLFAASTIGLAVILYLGYASLVILKLVCVVCVVTYASVIGMFLVSGAATAIPMSSLPGRLPGDLKTLRDSPLAMALSALFVVSAVAALVFFPRERESVMASATPAADAAPAGDTRAADFERWYASQPRVTIDAAADGAKVVIVKFNDYQCPACGQSYRDYKSVLDKYDSSQPGAVRVVMKDFPLEAECNTGGSHQAACEAAVAVRLARETGKAAALEEWLYSNQADLTPDRVRQAAREIGGVTDFEARYQATLAQVRADADYGRQLGIRSTPTFFINGAMVEGALPPVYFDQAIAYELARAK
jgi:protein-disulfide isomerase/uncharacterized membrane protein